MLTPLNGQALTPFLALRGAATAGRRGGRRGGGDGRAITAAMGADVAGGRAKLAGRARCW